MHFSTLLTLAASVQLSIAGYVLEDDYTQNFFSNFDFFTATDPTNGFVKYVDQATAQSSQLISTSNGSIYMGVDHTNVAPSGRPSVRLTSKKSYNNGLIILDVAHMPVGCGTWPAFWTVGPNWPDAGEIDILEGVNEQVGNAMTLHTGAGCSISNGGGFSGSITTSNCDVNAADQDKNAGCQIFNSATNSYGAGLNAIQGGVYATEWTATAIKVFFFPRSQIPSDITSGSPNPSGWGTPAAVFQGGCNIEKTFTQQQIVFDTTFCGDWAGNVWTSSTCASKATTCNAFVQNNPSAFTNAYWSINSLKVYQSGGSSSSQSAAIPSGSSTAAPSISTPVISIPISSVLPNQTTFARSTRSRGPRPSGANPSGVSTQVPGFTSILGLSSFPSISSILPNEGLSTVAQSAAASSAPAQVKGQMASFIAYPSRAPYSQGNRTRASAPTGGSHSTGLPNAASSSLSTSSLAIPFQASNTVQGTVFTTLTLTDTVQAPGNTGAVASQATGAPSVSVLHYSDFPSHAQQTQAPRLRARKERLRRFVREGQEGDEVLVE